MLKWIQREVLLNNSGNENLNLKLIVIKQHRGSKINNFYKCEKEVREGSV